MSIYESFCRETIDAKGVLREFSLDYPENFNFGYDVVDVLGRKSPEKRALVWCDGQGQERIFTFAHMSRLSNQAANALLQGGIRPGDRVLVMLKRHDEYWPCAIALHKIGAVMVPATHMLTCGDLEYRLERADIRGVICTPDNGVPEKLAQAMERVRRPILRWCVRRDIPGFRNLTREMTEARDWLERIPTCAEDPMLLYFTSGTTGLPKGVIHDHTYPLSHIVTAKYWHQAEDGGLHFTVAETGWAKASWGKLYGQWLMECAVMVFDFDNFDPRQLTAVINRYGVTSFCAPPTVYRYLVRKGIPDMPTLRHATTAGEMLAPEVFRRFTEATGIPLCEGYGQTETALLMANFKGTEPVAGSMGTASPMYRIQLQDRQGNVVPAGEIGEVVLLPRDGKKIPGVFSGYLDGEAQYRQVWRGGVYHTGDAAYQDPQGRYWFHGRFDDIIKTGGFRVGPYEIENILMEHPAVLECSVVGVPDPLRGQSIKAVVVPGAEYSPTPALAREIREFCNQRLADYKWIRTLEFVREMPKTISGKIQKKRLRGESA